MENNSLIASFYIYLQMTTTSTEVETNPDKLDITKFVNK